MALRLNDATAIINRLTNLVPASTDYCCRFWIKLGFTSSSPDYIAPLAITNAAYTAWTGVFGNAALSDNSHHVNVSDGGSPVTTANKILTANRQMFIGYRRSGANHFFYVDSKLIGSVTKDISAVAFFEMLLGNDRFSVVNGPIDIWEFAEWNTSKSAAFLLAEMQSFGAVTSSSNLITHTPLDNNLNDISGNNNHWSGSGNFSFVSTPGHPTNVTPALATDLSFPLIAATEVQRVDVDGHAFTVYRKYTNNTGKDQVLSIGHWGDSLGPYRPDCQIYSDVSLATEVFNHLPNGSSTLPIPNGVTYWFEFNPFDGYEVSSPANLNIKTLLGPNNAALAGDVFIRSASFSGGADIDDVLIGLHGGYIRPGSGIIGFKPQFPTGESGDILPSTGRMIFADESKSWEASPGTGKYYIYLFDRNFVELSKIVWDSPLSPPGKNRTHLPTDRVYFTGNLTGGGGTNYSWLNAAGAQGPIGNIPHAALTSGFISAIAVNNAATHMYVGVPLGGSPHQGQIKRWNLGTLTFDSDLAALVANYRVTDILVLPDDTIIAMYYKSSATRDFFIRRYDAVGAILNTYTLSYVPGLGGTAPRLGYSAQVDAFWVLHHLTTDYNVSTKMKTDGTILSTTTTPNVLQSDNEQVNPPIPYTSDSCPIIELRLNQTGSGGTIIIIKTTNPATVSDEFTVSVGGGLIPSSFILKNGESQIYESVPAGIYSVVESPKSGFSIVYNVSDGSPNTNINLADGETVTVIIVNTLIQKVMSGIYKVVKGKRQDTLWLENFTGTRDVKIP